MYKLLRKIIPAGLNIVCLNLWLLTPVAQASCTQGIGTKTADGKFLVSGVSAQQITVNSGTATGIDVYIGGVPTPSGDIFFELDNSKTNLIIYNFDSGYITFNTNILIDIPGLGLTDEPLNLIESAFLPDFNLIIPPDPPTSTELTYMMEEGFVSQPSAPTQTSTVSGTTIIGSPTGDYKTLEFVGDQMLELFGGGEIQSGVLTGLAFYSLSYKDILNPRWSVSTALFNPSSVGISNPPSNNSSI
jgi:hypothetical protein